MLQYFLHSFGFKVQWSQNSSHLPSLPEVQARFCMVYVKSLQEIHPFRVLSTVWSRYLLRFNFFTGLWSMNGCVRQSVHIFIWYSVLWSKQLLSYGTPTLDISAFSQLSSEHFLEAQENLAVSGMITSLWEFQGWLFCLWRHIQLILLIPSRVSDSWKLIEPLFLKCIWGFIFPKTHPSVKIIRQWLQKYHSVK